MVGAYIFLAVFIILGFIGFPIGLYMIGSLKGRRLFLRLMGNKIINDYGIFSDNKLFSLHQVLRLIECEKKGNRFYVIEETIIPPGGGQRWHWLKLDIANMEELTSKLSEDVS
jgi:hypothetical protein